jgi:RecJ-like exonuclease
MRCPDCNKFVSFDTDTEPEVDDLEVDESGRVTGTVRIVNTCAECGAELKEATFDLEIDLVNECEDHVNEEGKDSPHSLEVESDSAERTEREDGKPGTPARYRRHYYGAEVRVTVTCDCDTAFKAEGEWSDDVQGSGMEEM